MYSSEISKNPRGAALVIAMLVMAVLLLAGTTFLTISSTEYQIAINEQASARSFELADMGLQRATASLSANPAYSGETNVPISVGLPGSRSVIGNATINVGNTSQTALTDMLNQTCPIRDVAVDVAVPLQGGNSRTTLRATVEGVTKPFRWGMYGQGIYVYGYGGQSVLDSYDSRLGGYGASLGSASNSGGSLDLAASSWVELYYVTYSGKIYSQYAWSSPSVGTWAGGSQSSPAPPLVPPAGQFSGDIVVPDNGTLELSPGSYNSISVGDSSVLTLSSGTYHLNFNSSNTCGYAVFRSPDNSWSYNVPSFSLCLGTGAKVLASGPVTIYVRGNVSAADNSKIGGTAQFSGSDNSLVGSPGQAMRIMMTPTIPGWGGFSGFYGSNFSYFGILYGPNTYFDFTGNSLVVGSIIGTYVESWPWWSSAQFKFHFDRALSEQILCASRFSVRPGSWQEATP
jgi:Tfp pilus assembly protein PilX